MGTSGFTSMMTRAPRSAATSIGVAPTTPPVDHVALPDMPSRDTGAVTLQRRSATTLTGISTQRKASRASSGVNLHVAARPPHAHQDIPLGFVARLQSVLGIHLYIAFEQFGDTSAATPLAAAAGNIDAAHFRNLEQSLARGHIAHLAGTYELDRPRQLWRGLQC